MTLGIERWSHRGTRLAAALGKSPVVVGYWAGEGVRRRLEEPDFARSIDDLDAARAALVANGGWRIVYRVVGERVEVLVVAIGHRREVYDRLRERLR